jgi:hypothetical protein
MAPRRDDGLCAASVNVLDKRVTIVTFVGDDRPCLNALDQCERLVDVGYLACGKNQS